MLIRQQGLSVRSAQSGISLVEVLVTILITMVGLLGFAALQARALGSTEESYARSQAAAIAQDMIERVRSNMGGEVMKAGADLAALKAAYVSEAAWTGSEDESDCITNTCTATQMASFDIAQVRTMVERLLPNGSALMQECGTNEQLCAVIAWGNATATECATSLGAQCLSVQGL